eukprot:4792491-Prymnesium_polylepis.1
MDAFAGVLARQSVQPADLTECAHFERQPPAAAPAARRKRADQVVSHRRRVLENAFGLAAR